MMKRYDYKSLLTNAVQSVKTTFWTNCFIDINRDLANTILVAGFGRSGTTWLGDIINFDHSHRNVFEPFHPYFSPISQKLINHWYIRPDNQDSDLIQYARSILSGSIRSHWSDRFNDRFLRKKRIIKSVHANLFIKWIHNHFPEIKIVYILRHPCAVASSRTRIDSRAWDWRPSAKDLLSQKELYDDYLKPFESYIKNISSDFENHIFCWCINNYVALKQLKADDVHTVYYEKLCTEPEHGIKALFKYLKLNFSDEVIQKAKRPSNKAIRESAILTGGNLVDNWCNQITKDQLKQAMDTVALFGLDNIYNEDPMPLIK